MFGVTKPPVFELKGTRPGKTLLITAGMDGDEYVGIEAAYRLVKTYTAGEFAGTLIVIPIVNVAGFFAEQSKNPHDGKYPKYIFPGRAWGSASERLVHWLSTQYVYRADAWFDLHSGALSEAMTPLLWTYKTNTPADNTTEAFIAASGASVVVHESAESTNQPRTLAPRGIMYALAEAGGRGERNEADIAQHVRWTEALMRTLGMLEPVTIQNTPQIICTAVEYVVAPFDSVVRQAPLSTLVHKGDLIATCTTFTGATHEVHAPQSGTVLYRKETMAAQRGDTLCAIGY